MILNQILSDLALLCTAAAGSATPSDVIDADAAAATAPEFEGGDAEAKQVAVKEEHGKPHILLKRQSKDETTGKNNGPV